MITLEMNTYYDRFLQMVARHRWHRTVVKTSLTRQLIELMGGDEAAKEKVNKIPYDKEKFWRMIFSYLVDKYNYTFSTLHTVNSGIVGRIQFDELV